MKKFSDLKISTRISLGVVFYTIVSTIVVLPFAYNDSEEMIDHLMYKRLSTHYSILNKAANTESLENLRSFATNYKEKYHIDSAFYYINNGNVTTGFSTLGKEPILGAKHYLGINDGECNIKRVDVNGANTAVCVSGLKDKTGKIVAALEVAMDATYYEQESRKQLESQVIQGALTILFSILISQVISRSIAHPITKITATMKVLSEGNHSVTIPYTENKDEVGAMARALAVFKEHVQSAEAHAQERMNEQVNREKEQVKRIEDVRQFANSANAAISFVTTAAEEMKNSAVFMSNNASSTTTLSERTLSTSNQVTENIQTVASAAEQLTASIKEIASQISQSTQIAKQAVSNVNHTNETVTGLSDAASKIGEVISIITDIAEQTNLLALNATIEAARAGDAGKGFAVVASEVKNLADQTEKATHEIANQIKAIQQNTLDAVNSMQNVSNTIQEIDHISSVIGDAIVQQNTAAQDISRNILQAATSTQTVNTTVSDVVIAAGETGQSSSQVLDLSHKVLDQATSLKNELENFTKQTL